MTRTTDERFGAIAVETLKHCEDVDCSVGDFVSGLSIVVDTISDARSSATEGMNLGPEAERRAEPSADRTGDGPSSQQTGVR